MSTYPQVEGQYDDRDMNGVAAGDVEHGLAIMQQSRTGIVCIHPLPAYYGLAKARHLNVGATISNSSNFPTSRHRQSINVIDSTCAGSKTCYCQFKDDGVKLTRQPAEGRCQVCSLHPCASSTAHLFSTVKRRIYVFIFFSSTLGGPPPRLFSN